MSNVHFDPKIATDLPVDWRRPASGQGSDVFADLLKQRLDKGERELPPRRSEVPARHHEDEAEPVSGRPPRVVIAHHQKTIRGEATEVRDPTERCLLTKTECTNLSEKPDADDAEEAQQQDAVASQSPAEDEQGEAKEAPSDDKTEAAADLSPPTGQPDEAAQAVAMIVVPVQTTEQAAPVEPEALLQLLAAPAPAGDPQSALPVQPLLPLQGAPEAQSDGSQTSADTTTEQQAVVATAATALADVVTTLSTSQAVVPAQDAQPVPAAAGSSSAPATATQSASIEPEQTLVQTPQARASVAEVAPASAPQPRADHTPMDIKLRSNATSVRPDIGDRNPNAALPQQPQAHHGVPMQAATGETTTAGDQADQPLMDDSSGPGWTIHLAQGAAAKRPDFVAQLRQHLQNLPAHEQVAVHVQRAVREGTGRFSIQLSPADLGQIHVKLEINEDKRVTAAVTVEKPSTLELLQREVKGLERALHNAGLSMEGGDLSFSLGRGSDQDFAQDFGRSGNPAASGSGLDAESEGDQPLAAAAQVMDTAAGVVNLQV